MAEIRKTKVTLLAEPADRQAPASEEGSGSSYAGKVLRFAAMQGIGAQARTQLFTLALAALERRIAELPQPQHRWA